MELTEGGLSEVEKRAIRDSIIHCNVSEIHILENKTILTNQQALDIINENLAE